MVALRDRSTIEVWQMEIWQSDSWISVDNVPMYNAGEITVKGVDYGRGELKARLALDLGGRTELKVRRCGDGSKECRGSG